MSQLIMLDVKVLIKLLLKHIVWNTICFICIIISQIWEIKTSLTAIYIWCISNWYVTISDWKQHQWKQRQQNSTQSHYIQHSYMKTSTDNGLSVELGWHSCTTAIPERSFPLSLLLVFLSAAGSPGNEKKYNSIPKLMLGIFHLVIRLLYGEHY